LIPLTSGPDRSIIARQFPRYTWKWEEEEKEISKRVERVEKRRGREREKTNHGSSRLELEGLLRLVVDEVVQVGSEGESLLGSD